MRERDLASLLREVRRLCPETPVLEAEPMSRHCSFRIGGPCDAMLLPGSPEELERICRLLAKGGERPFLMGNGTNLLITDGPFRRVVIRLGERFAALTPEGDDSLEAQAGILLSQLAAEAARRGLAGLEFAHGIPGSLGGAVSMNAGAYGGEIKDVLTSVVWLDKDLALHESSDAGLSYRRSHFTDTDDIVVRARVRLSPDDPESIRERMRVLADRRRASQPLELPSAGSTFKRPVGGYAAALIDRAGLRGFAVGGAQVSETHAGFVVNRGGASFEDVLRLMEHIQETVFRTSGIALEPEVKILRG